MSRDGPSWPALVAAFAAIYLVWGSTYLAIRFVVADMPPFLSAAARWLVPGALAYAWFRARGAAAPTRAQWASAGLVGLGLVVGGNGTVAFAEQWVPSSLAALVISTVPLWMALLDWWHTRRAPHPRVLAGIALGLAGVAFLVARPQEWALDARGAWGAALLVGASLSWAAGSLYSRRADLARPLMLFSAMQMLLGGTGLLLLGLVTGEAARVDLAAVGVRAWLSLAYLAFFGSLVAYAAYVWLLQVTRPERVSTYAFVNPVVAVLLGVALAGEPFSARTALVAAVIVAAVALVVTSPRPRPLAA